MEKILKTARAKIVKRHVCILNWRKWLERKQQCTK